MNKYSIIFIGMLLLGYPAIAQIHTPKMQMLEPSTDSLLAIINKPTEDTGKVLAFHVLAAMTVGTNAPEAIAYSKSGLELGRKLNFDRGIAGCLLNISYCYSAMGRLDSALPYIDTAIAYYRKSGVASRIAMAYLNRGDYNLQLRRFNESLADCDTAFQFAEKTGKGDAKGRVYQTIGSVYFLQGNYEQSKLYYEKAYPLFEKTANSIMMINVLNNIGKIYKQTKEYDQSIATFEKAIAQSISIHHENNLSTYYSNLSDVWYEKGDKKKAEINAIKAVEYARIQKNDLQIAAAQNVLANIYLTTGRTKEAITAAQESFVLAEKNDIHETAQKAAEELAAAYLKTGNYKEAYRFIEYSKKLNDSLVKQKYDKDVVAMQTNFKVNEKDKEIQLLNKDRELQKQQLKQQSFIAIAAAAIAILALIGIWLFVNRNSLRHRMKELELRNNIAADLHDEVGSSLSSIHMLSQMAAQGNGQSQQEILSRMSVNAKETMDKMGDIVWMIKPGETEAGSLKQRMERFAYEICSTKNIEVHTQLSDLETVVLSMEQRKNIYLIFKEALNNAVKYSGTNRIDISATIENGELVMGVRDFGKGFDSKLIKKGNGLDNMRHRAKEINAFYEMLSPEKSGTVIQLKLKL